MTDVIGQLRTLVSDLEIPEEARARIESLFLAQQTGRTVVSPPTDAPSGEPSAAQGAPAAGVIEPQPAPMWERYEDLALIGRGGMGEVRRVRDRLLGRVLAMKLLPADRSTDRGLRMRFAAEARLTAEVA